MKYNQQMQKQNEAMAMAKAPTKAPPKARDSAAEPGRFFPIADRWTEQLNREAGTAFRVGAASNRKHAVARLEEGATESEGAAVISLMVKRWKGSDMEPNLNMTTLFRPANFEKYRGHALKGPRRLVTDDQPIDVEALR